MKYRMDGQKQVEDNLVVSEREEEKRERSKQLGGEKRCESRLASPSCSSLLSSCKPVSPESDLMEVGKLISKLTETKEGGKLATSVCSLFG